MTKRPLRIGLFVPNSDALEQWMLRLIEKICAHADFELAGLVTQQRKEIGEVQGLFRFWWALEKKIVARATPAVTPEFEKVRPSLPIVDVENSEEIQDLGCDIIVDLTPGQGKELDPAYSRYGIWFLSFIHPGAGLDSVRAILSKERLIDVKLFRQKIGVDGTETIATATLNTKFAASLNHLYLCEKSVTLIFRELRRVFQMGDVEGTLEDDKPSRDPLSPLVILRYTLHLALETATRLGQKIGTKLGLRPGMFYLQTVSGSLNSFDPAKMQSQKVRGNNYYADPFLWSENGVTYCFFEVYDYRTLKGHIGAGRFEDGNLVDVKPIIKSEYHMSYPFLFRHDGDLYMLPETGEANRIELWKCVEFPYNWEFSHVILDGVQAADSSIAEIEGEWWLFTNISTDIFGEMNSELHIYKIDSQSFGRVMPHAFNPVVFDARTARNAGRILNEGEVRYRPSQNNSHGLYGYGLNLMQIDLITLTEYEETLVREIRPDFSPGLIGCHHIDKRDGLIVIDARKRFGGRSN